MKCFKLFIIFCVLFFSIGSYAADSSPICDESFVLDYTVMSSLKKPGGFCNFEFNWEPHEYGSASDLPIEIVSNPLRYTGKIIRVRFMSGIIEDIQETILPIFIGKIIMTPGSAYEGYDNFIECRLLIYDLDDNETSPIEDLTAISELEEKARNSALYFLRAIQGILNKK